MFCFLPSRYFLLVVVSPILVFLFVGVWLPESPRYLSTTGKRKQLMAVIERMCKTNGKQPPKGTLTEVRNNKINLVIRAASFH